MYDVEQYSCSGGFIQVGATIPTELKRDAYEVLRLRGEKFNVWLRGKMVELVQDHYQRLEWEAKQEQSV